jgi:Malate/lactate dehydrogenases
MKIAIFGIGHVGAHVANALCLYGLAQEILFFDIKEEKIISEINDLNDSQSFFPHSVILKKGDFTDLADTDIIINSVGKIDILIETGDRVGEMKFTVDAVLSYIDRIKASGFKGIFINITNPCDIITKICAQHLEPAEGRVFGTGTGLDSARLTASLARRLGVDQKSISAFMLGEHGNQQIAAFSNARVNGIPLSKFAKLSDEELGRIEHEAIRGGWVTFNGKHCTEYAIALTAARVVRAVKYDEKLVIPASAHLDGQYGEKAFLWACRL